MSSELRYERKLLFPGDAEAALAAARLHPALFAPAFPDRWVNNLYLDTPGRGDLADSLDGVSPRAKLRVRWYGPALAAAAPRLEFKRRHGTVTGKEVHALRAFRLDGAAGPGTSPARAHAWPRSADLAAGAELPPLLREELLRREPVLFNRYLRSYFLSADRVFRLTVDRELGAASRDLGHPIPGRHDGHGAAAPVVLELKYPPEAEERAAAVSEAFGLRLARFSKYVAGATDSGG